MLNMSQRGVATAIVVVAIVAVAGGTIGAPVAVDMADVDPDHPLYGLERVGERIRMTGDEDQMKERWGEYVRLVNRGKGLQYKEILEEFKRKLEEVAPGDVAAKQDVVKWMQEQMPGIGRVQLKLQEELAGKLKGQLSELPNVQAEIENEINEIGDLREALKGIKKELPENIRAHMRLIRAKLENIAEKHGAQIERPVNPYFDIDNMLVDVDVTVNVETGMRPITITQGSFEDALDEFDSLLSEVRTMLEGTPKNTVGKRAAERLVEVATELRDKAVAAYDKGKVRRALGLIHGATIHLRNAKQILEHGSEWEPKFKGEWTSWENCWENLKEGWMKEGVWENILENHEKYAGRVERDWENEKEEFKEKFLEGAENISIKDILKDPAIFYYSDTEVAVVGEILVENGIDYLHDGTGKLPIYMEEPPSGYGVGAEVIARGEIEFKVIKGKGLYALEVEQIIVTKPPSKEGEGYQFRGNGEVKFKGEVLTDPIQVWTTYVKVRPYEIITDEKNLLRINEIYPLVVKVDTSLKQGDNIEVYAWAWFGEHAPMHVAGMIVPNQDKNPDFYIKRVEEERPIADVTPPVISDLTINEQAVTAYSSSEECPSTPIFSTEDNWVIVAGKVTDDQTVCENIVITAICHNVEYTVNAEADGSFSIRITLGPFLSPPGTEHVWIRAYDEAGNSTTAWLGPIESTYQSPPQPLSVTLTIENAVADSTKFTIKHNGGTPYRTLSGPRQIWK